jgi:hypothetical protein
MQKKRCDGDLLHVQKKGDRVTHTTQKKVMTSTPGIVVVSFNMLAHAYTKFNSALHKAPHTREETKDQRDARRERNAALVATLRPSVLLLQEHDDDVVIPGYGRGVRAFVDSRSEGCSVLLADDYSGTIDKSFTVDLGEGKSAAAAFVKGVWYMSSHLKGGPDSEYIKIRQVNLLLETLEKMAGKDAPAVWAGDMNDTKPEAQLVTCAAPKGFALISAVGPTGLTSKMDTALALDHVFVRGVPGVRLTIPHAPRIGGPWDSCDHGSDHVPLVISL